MITLKHKGDFSNTKKILNGIINKNYLNVLERYGKEGIKALEEYTPKRTGLTSRSWSYGIEQNRNEIILTFYNSNIQNGVNVAVIIQYGHGTSRGYFVQGVDYINPALKPVFNNIAKDLWKEVTG